MQFSTTFLTTLLLTVTSVAGVAVPVAVPDPSPVAAAVAGPVEVPDSSLRFNAIVPRQSQPAGPSPTGACQFGSYKCSGKSIYQCNNGWKLVSNCGRTCTIINGSPFCT